MKRMIKKIIVMTLSLVLVLINMSYVFAESEAASIVVDDNAFTEISEANGEILPYGTSKPSKIHDLSKSSLNVRGSITTAVYSNYKFKPVNGKISIRGYIGLTEYSDTCYFTIKLCDTNIFSGDKVVYKSSSSEKSASIDKTMTGLNDDHYYYLYITKSSSSTQANADINLVVSKS